VSSYVFDARYISMLRDRDPEVCDHFTVHFSFLLDHILRGSLRDRHLVADLRNETLYRVLKHVDRGQIREPEHFGSFVRRVSKIVVLEHFRKKHWNECQMGEDVPEMINPEERIDNYLQRVQTRDLVRPAIAELNERDRKVIVEICIKGRDRHEVAKEEGTDLGGLRVRLHRALERLKKSLSGTAYDFPPMRRAETVHESSDTRTTEGTKK